MSPLGTLRNKIKAAFPDLLYTDWPGYYDLGCGRGWYPIVLGACGELDRHNKHIAELFKGSPYRQFRLAQIKEKFGTLHIYANIVRVPPCPSCDGCRRIFPEGGPSQPCPTCGEEATPWEFMVEVCGVAGRMSAHVCEECGEAGSLRDRRWWIKTLCDACDGVRSRKSLTPSTPRGREVRDGHDQSDRP